MYLSGFNNVKQKQVCFLHISRNSRRWLRSKKIDLFQSEYGISIVTAKISNDTGNVFGNWGRANGRRLFDLLISLIIIITGPNKYNVLCYRPEYDLTCQQGVQAPFDQSFVPIRCLFTNSKVWWVSEWVSEWVSGWVGGWVGGLTACRQLRPSSRRKHVNASSNLKLFIKACTAQLLSGNLKSLLVWQS